MSLYILGLKMPKRMPIKATIYPDGRVIVTLHSGKILERKAVPVPQHGRLGDLDALHKLFIDKAREHKGIGGVMLAMAALCLAKAPTILPAEEGE